MNTNDEKIQWHPAFDAALQIEFGDEAKYLEFDPEHLISKKPMQIDVLVKNEKHVKLKKNIRRVFRQYNIIEYKSPEDDLDIDDFYKTYAYACLYKSDTETVDLIPADELTITFVCYHYPRNMLRKLEQDRKFSVEQQDSGIYYLIGDAIPIQLVIVPKLSKEHNYWLNNLRNDLKAGSEIKKITESGLKSIDNTAITHSSVGDFTYNPKTGAVSKMKGGGHGQANIEFLEANGLEYNIVKVYDNGVRIGNILDHKVKAKRTGTNQSWFPESWSESDIANAGAYIGNLLENVNAADGVTVFGNYNGVRVGVIRTNGRISTIFPDAASQP